MKQTPWIGREFPLELPGGLYPNVIERLRGTPGRIVERVEAAVPPAMLTGRIGKGWSIQEHVGHLVEIGSLWLGRVDDLEAGLEVLRPADIENRRTEEADYNRRDIGGVLREFSALRRKLVGRLERLDEAVLQRLARHPRLNRPMRAVDLAFFAAEHDDHHLARISELIRALGG